MDHYNVVKLYEVYEDQTNFYLIMDLIKGGELFNEIVKRKNLTEKVAQCIIFQILMGINYIHK